MANSMPFNSINADRPYKAEDWAWYFGTFIGNGVFPKPETGLQVVANEGMKITVNEGKAFINGYAFKNPSNYEITLDTADGALARIDRVVVRWDLVNRDMYIDVLKGTVSASPKAVDVTRNSEIYELALADVTVSKGVTSITQAYITDQRFNTALCGIVKGTVEEIDTSVIIAQFEDFVKTYQDEQLAEFEEWVESIKDVLDENAAGNLQLQIDEHVPKEVPSEVGAHGFRYFEGKLQAHIYDEESMTLKWVTVPGSGIVYDGDKSVQGAIDEIKGTIGYTSKNLLANPGNSATVNNNVFTAQTDKTFVVTGTSGSGVTQYYFVQPLKKGKYIANGCPKGGSTSSYWVYVSVNGEVLGYDTGEGVEFELEEDCDVTYCMRIASNGYTANSLVFKPMIRYASIEDDTYEPYVADVQTQIDNTIKKTDVINFTHHLQASVTTQSTVIKEYTVPKRGMLFTSYIMYENSASIAAMAISINGMAHAAMTKSTDSNSLTVCSIVNAGDVIKWTVKGASTGSPNNTIINGFIISV